MTTSILRFFEFSDARVNDDEQRAIKNRNNTIAAEETALGASPLLAHDDDLPATSRVNDFMDHIQVQQVNNLTVEASSGNNAHNFVTPPLQTMLGIGLHQIPQEEM